MKEKLITAPVLTHDDGVSQLELHTDASSHGIGGVLRLHKDGVKKPITYASRRLDCNEENYHINELEFLAVLWTLEKFRHHVYGRNVLVRTDSSVLKYVFDRADATKNPRLSRWVMELRGYDLTVQHLKGASNAVADALSRFPVDEVPDTGECHIGAIIPGGYQPRELAILQHADADIRKRVLDLQGIGDRQSEDTRSYVLYEGILYRRNLRPGRRQLLVIPSVLRKDLIREYHDAPTGGHFGREKTLSRLSQRFFWKGMEKSVEHYVRSCPFCQLYKSRQGKKAGKLQPITPPKLPYEQIGIDHLGPFKKTKNGNLHLIVTIDYLTRYVEAKAVPSTDSTAVIEFLEKDLFARHGVVEKLISDSGSAFTSVEFQNYMKKKMINHILASVEHPETNGLVEKANRTITSAISAYVNLTHTDWDDQLPNALFAINTAKQATTKISPFELLYGRTARTPIELAFPWPPDQPERKEVFFKKVWRWRKTARNLIIRQQKKSKSYVDLYRSPDPTFQRGELVVIYKNRRGKGRTKKLLPRAQGPYQIQKRVSRTCYRVEDIPNNRRGRTHRIFNAHVSIIKPYIARREMDWFPEEEEGESEPDEGEITEDGPLSGANEQPSRNEEGQGEVLAGEENHSVEMGLGIPEDEAAVTEGREPEEITLPVVTRSGRISRFPREDIFTYYGP